MADIKAPDITTSLCAGAAAGVVVDLTLFPLDTLKTRLQSKAGFIKSGGFSKIYKGIGPALVGSAPTSALFFMAYNSLINNLQPITGFWTPVNHILAAGLAEVVASSLRVPIEIVKQRKQAGLITVSSFSLVSRILREEGVRGMYRGFSSTIAREIPFGAIQYPVWEWLKFSTGATESIQIGICGAFAGALAAAITTPLDVIKTRVMLAEAHLAHKHQSTFGLTSYIARDLYQEKGFKGFFSGIVPRVLWITIGGFIYFGVYGKTVNLMDSSHDVLLEPISLQVDGSSPSSQVY